MRCRCSYGCCSTTNHTRTRSRRPKGHPTFSRRSWRKPPGRANLWIGIQVLHHHGAVFFDGIGREPIELRMFVHHLPIEGKTPHKIWNICYIYIYTDNQYRCCVNVNSIRFLFTSQMWRAWVNRSQTGSPEMMCTSPRQSKELISIMRCGVIESPKVSMGKVSWVWVSFFRREKEIPTSPPNKLCLLKQHHLPRWHLLSSSFHLAVFRGPHSGRPQAVGRKPQYQSLRKVLSHYFKFGIYGTYMIRNIVIHPYNYCRINQVFCVCSYFT